ncbi:probable disease resistance protein At4g27220 [Dioscorea cayenensis subsp. rotundata]|uniref:Probable disease resistance protein At4g27220 n=1 Tax=Dioscorea cayennensis subsp. rotundata TaxID=55577 RepID=A0AB40CJK5_DIOCR|nr:probable disease resistance protein At4g27220 [Dioscorea cayenensis subsp. rotundata]
MDQVLNALKDEHVHIVGVCGMGGVGKTTLIKEVAKRAKNEKLFNEVVMVTISQNPNIKSIQNEIAERLGLRLDEESEEVRAMRIDERLGKSGRILIILDDVWEKLELTKIRISQKDNCKVAVTTRSRDSCEQIQCQKTVEMKPLNDGESWFLFKSRAGDLIESPMIQRTARDVFKECGGLPLVLAILGTALKGKDPEIWTVALNQLRKSVMLDLPNVSKQVYQSIELSYKFLESHAVKLCFLLCCVFPEDHDIDEIELMRLMVGEGLLIDGADTMDLAQSRVRGLTDILKGSNLLLESQKERHVKMHDVVRDVAIWISQREQGFHVQSGVNLIQWPHTQQLQECRRLSLMRNEIAELPDMIDCPKLQTLILSHNRISRIPDQFFSQMGSLLVLDLSFTNISSLPKSVSCLTNLKTLNLECCQSLKDVSRIRELKKLEILNLGRTQLSFFPREAAALIHLRCLDLTAAYSTSKSLASHLVRVPYKAEQSSRVLTNILIKLGNLEQLFMDNFDVEFGELARLTRLTHLFVHVEDSASLSQDLGSSQLWAQLTNFCICFVPRIRQHSNPLSRHGKTLHLTKTKGLAGWVKVLLDRTTSLELFDCEETTLLSQSSSDTDFPASLFSNLKHLRVDGWKNLIELGDDQSLPEGAFDKLRDMSVVSCPKLRSLLPCKLWTRMNQLKKLVVKECHEMLQLFPYITGMVEDKEKPSSSSTTLQGLGIFNSLRVLHVVSCPKLTYIFLLKQAGGMQHLEELHVEDCAALERIVVSEEEKQVDDCLFPLLKKLLLISLHELTALVTQTVAWEWPSLEYLELRSCPKIMKTALIGPLTSERIGLLVDGGNP